MIETSNLEMAREHANRRREAALEALRLRQQTAELDLRIRRQEASIRAAIAAEIDFETGKALYSNDVKRDAEFIARSANDTALQSLKSERDRKEFDASAVGIDVQYHADMVRVLCAFAGAGQEVD